MSSVKTFSFLLITILIAFSLTKLQSQNVNVFNGIVIDTETKKPIAGATLRVLNTERGTYTSSSGKFRLPIPIGAKIIKVSSLGYETKFLGIEGKMDTLYIGLKPSSIKMKSVEVTGKIDANEIIKRAIERKEENLKKLKTFSGMLYSKLVLELAGSIFGGPTQGGFQVSSTIGETAPEKFKMFVLETFSKTYRDFEKNITRTDIIQRRQTSNIPPQQNLLAIGNFMNFYDDEIEMLDTKIPTPLSSSAFSYYNFELVERNTLDDRFVYLIKVQPVTTAYPAFTGSVSIVEGTYNLVEVSLQPSENTSIPFLDSLKFLQKFEESSKRVWYPSFLELTAKVRVDVIKGMLDATAFATATSIYSETIINEPLPDSIYEAEKPRIITVSKGADSTRTEFWENNSLREITPRELSMYHEVDSLSAISDSLEKEKSAKFFDYYPDIRFNRVCSIGLGAWASLFYNKVGWRAGISARLPFVQLFGFVEIAKYDSLQKTTYNSIFSSSIWRNNPAIVPDNYRIIAGGLYLNSSSFLRNTDFNASVKLNAMYGDMEEQNTLFHLFEGELKLVIPTFYTGYTPMNLELLFIGGKSCKTTPYQEQFRMPTRLSIIGQSGVFYSAPIGVFGGNEYYTAHINYNLTDLWWRAIGLPRYEGRR